MKFIKLFISIFFVFVFSSICFGQSKQDFICENSIFACYGDIAHIYKTTKKAFIEGYEKKDSKTLEELNTFKAYLAQYPILNSYSKMTDDELISLLNNWDDEGFFVPTGIFKASLSSDKGFYLQVEAKIDTNFIIDKICSEFPEDSIKSKKKSDGSISIELSYLGIKLDKNAKGTIKVSISKDLNFEIQPQGIFINQLGENKKEANKSWGAMLNNISDSNCFMHTEGDIKELHKFLVENGFSKTNLTNTILTIVSKIPRIRFIGKKNNYIMMVAFTDEKYRKEILDKKDLIQDYVKLIIGEPTTVIDKSPWLGLQTNSNSESISSMGFAFFAKLIIEGCNKIFVATCLNSPDVQRNICYNISSKLTFAIEMYNIDNSENKITSMNKGEESEQVIEKLLKSGYIKERPQCLSSDKFSYFSDGDLSNSAVVECEIHGTPFNGYSEEEILQFKSDFAIQKRNSEIMICGLNLQDFNKKLAIYNTTHPNDKITFIEKGKCDEVLNKIYGNNKAKYPICPLTKKSSFYTNGSIEDGYNIECEVHGIPSIETLEQEE